MVFSYNWLQSFFKKKLPKPEKLAELLTMYSFEVSEVEKSGQDWILNIDVLPNRGPDCFSHLGIAREISTVTGLEYITEPGLLQEDKEIRAKDFIKVEVKNKIACQRYTARVICDVKIDFSPKWMRERLEVCGLKPINNIVDIANYVMLETGQPLHAFDFEKISGVKLKIKNQKPSSAEQDEAGDEAKLQRPSKIIKKIIVRKARRGEKITTLDEERYDLDENILVIADAKKPIAIAGIKGGSKAGITSKTRVVVLESANFNSRVIRAGSKRIDLKTDATLRFEHGIDPNLTEFAINRAAYLIQEIAKGKIVKGLNDIYSQKVLPKTIKLDLNYVERLLGVKISEKEIKNILQRLEFKILNSKFKILNIEIPTFRLDISVPEDLIEEIGRIYGYQKIPAQFPIAALIPPKRNLDIFWEDLSKDILKEAGFTETYNYSFISEKDKEIFKYDRHELMEVENPTSLDFQYLRPSLLPNLLKNIEKNFRNFSEIKIFELGKIFKFPKTEEKMLGGVMTGEVFYQAKGIIDLLLNKLAISNIWYNEYRDLAKEKELSRWRLGKAAEIKIDNERVGFLGEISAKILDEFQIKSKVIYFEIFFEKLSQLASEEHEYRPISKFPSAVRDIAVLVPREVRIAQVLNKIYDTGKELIRDVDLFDIYEGEELPADKKNLAFHIIYQAEDRTLTSEEIDGLQKNIISAIEKSPGWEVRK